MRIFLGGTCADTTWREEFIEAVKPFGIEYFNNTQKLKVHFINREDLENAEKESNI